MSFRSPEAISLYLDGLVQRLKSSSAWEEADQLRVILHESAWTTSSEWLGEIKLLLVKVHRTHQNTLSSTVLKEIDEFISFVDEAWNNANR